MTPKAKTTYMDRPAQAKALVRALKTARGDDKRVIEEEILMLGGDAVDALVEEMRREENPWKRLGYAWLFTAAALLLLGTFCGWRTLSLIGAAGLSTFLLLLKRITAATDSLRLLLQIDDPRAIAPLVAALPLSVPGHHGQAIQQRLAYLLPRLRREDAHLLPEKVRTRLRDGMEAIRESESPPDRTASDFLIAIIKGLVQIGDQDVRLHLARAQQDREIKQQLFCKSGSSPSVFSSGSGTSGKPFPLPIRR